MYAQQRFLPLHAQGGRTAHLPESNGQNLVVTEALLESAKRFARGGYGVIEVVLMAGRTETMKRAVGHSKLNKKTNAELVEIIIMWKQFCRLGDYERFVIKTTNRSIDETVSFSLIKERIKRRICKSWKSLRRFSTALT